MLKQLKKFRFFTSKSSEAKPSNNLPKNLHKEKSEVTDKRKIKSVNDADFCSKPNERRGSPGLKHRSHQKHSSASSRRKHGRESPRKNFNSRSDIYLSPEDIKIRRKAWNKLSEKSPKVSTERRKYKNCIHNTHAKKRESLKREIDASRVHTHKHRHNDTTDYQWLTKKEIEKVIPNHHTKEVTKRTSTWSSFWKKYFLFEKPELCHDSENDMPKTNRSAVDDNQRIFRHHRDSKVYSTRKLHKTRRIEKSVDDAHQKELKKLPERHRLENRKIPERPQLCLVKTTFAVVEISPLVGHESFLEKEKKRTTFKKYDDCNKTSIQNKKSTSNTSILVNFSECHELYQENSKYSLKNSPRNKNLLSKLSMKNFKVDTQISAVVFAPKAPTSFKNNSNNTKHKKSKIPILKNVSKTVETGKRRQKPFQRSPRKKVQVADKGVNTKLTKTISRESKPKTEEKILHRDDSKMKRAAPVTKESKVEVCKNKGIVKNEERNESKMSRISRTSKVNKNSTQNSFNSDTTRSVFQSHQKFSLTTSQRSESPGSTHTSSSSTRSIKTLFASHLDKKIRKINKTNIQRKYKILHKTSSKISVSNSTFDDNSLKSSNSSLKIPQQAKKKKNSINEKKQQKMQSNTTKFKNSLPQSFLKLDDNNEFQKIFEAAIEEIINQNKDFLQKDFKRTLCDKPKFLDNLTSDNLSP